MVTSFSLSSPSLSSFATTQEIFREHGCFYSQIALVDKARDKFLEIYRDGDLASSIKSMFLDWSIRCGDRFVLYEDYWILIDYAKGSNAERPVSMEVARLKVVEVLESTSGLTPEPFSIQTVRSVLSACPMATPHQNAIAHTVLTTFASRSSP
ncbi:hypothetical protein BT96DRAFT_541522 [Gymnopus androsaceus JB14]|uniref:Uncharacterized protein n=1 Tax=Gymnopus androsaceus JB14 TaxID=1447944 RepID=A0A6A4I003_9AGAR|nr:hypothetical protein BT96DRAFT_541522 [Gymnopus androsaceus JB14]